MPIFQTVGNGWSGPLKVSFAQNVTHKYRNGNGIIVPKLYATREFCVHSQVKNYNYWQKSFLKEWGLGEGGSGGKGSGGRWGGELSRSTRSKAYGRGSQLILGRQAGNIGKRRGG